MVAFRVFYCFLATIARDISEAPAMGATLVVAPHPDDEVLSCGAAIVRARKAGQRVRVVIVTDGSDSSDSEVITPEALTTQRRGEARCAIVKLGCDPEDLVFLDFRDGHASESIDEIARELKRQISEFLPRQIFSPYRDDPHADHRAVGLAVQKLIRKGAIHCRVYDFPRFQPKSALRHLLSPQKLMRVCRISTSGLLETKRAALAEHKSQCENLTGELSWNVLPAHWIQMFFQTNEIFLRHQ